MNKPLFAICFLLFVHLFGCSATQKQQRTITKPQINNDAFSGHIDYDVESVKDIFLLDNAAREFAEQTTAKQRTTRTKLDALVNAIFSKTSLSLDYRAEATTIARHTFNNREANCLSLTIMAYSMLDHLDINAKFQNVRIPEFWTMRGGSMLLNRHVNLVVRTRDPFTSVVTDRELIVDFDPQQVRRRFFTTIISKEELIAQFYINKAADLIVTEQYDHAFAYIKAAIEIAPEYEGSWLSLGVLFSKIDQLDYAEEYYTYALQLMPNYATAYENLAHLYQRTGRESKASEMFEVLHNRRVSNAYYHMMLGDVALGRDEMDVALTHYRDAVERNSKPHEFQFRIATVYYAQNNLDKALEYLNQAIEKAQTDEVKDQYLDIQRSWIEEYSDYSITM